ncbi:MAG: hypothetical protein WC175_03055 [Candidatus Dojkabacteria bacterium]
MNKKKKKAPHDFLSEELLVPGVNMCDTMRINMFDNHLLQSVVLKETDSPKVFTNFENQVGSISSAIKVAKSDLRIVAKFSINKFKTVYILADDDKKTLDVFISKEAFWLTEHYGWKNINYIDEFEVGEVFPKGEPLSANTSYDEEQNFGYGRNLNAVFLPYKNLTYEDAIIVSENAAKKLSSYNIHQIDVTVNTNDILLNLYGTGKYYKSFPEVGEEVNKKVLCARRRISYNSALAELKNSALAKLNPHTDTAFYVNGKIVDIEIFSNQPIEELKKHKFFRQEYQIVKQQLEYASDFIKVVDKIETSKKYQEYTLLDDLNYEYKKCMLAVDDEKKWVNENKEFNYLVYRFTIMEESPLKVGNKITNRYGGKGVISKILPDEEMPVNQYGERADIILNILGVINRTNIGQLIELEINFISREIERYIEKHIDNREKIEKVLFAYLKIANSEQYKFIKEKYDNMQEPYKVDFWKEIVEDGIYIHHPPFYNNINIDKLSKIYKIFDKIIKPYKFKGIKQRIIMGKMYYMRLTFSLL